MTTEKRGKINYSWNFSQSYSMVDAATTQQERGLWAFDHCAVFSLPRRQLLLKSRHTDGKLVVSSEVFQILQLCRQFRTLEEHIAVVKKMNPALAKRQSEISQIFNKFIEQGFMIPAKLLLTKLQHRGRSPSQYPLFGILVRTCDRPKSLARLIKSFAENERHHGQRYRYFAIDDSRSLENITENQVLIEQARKKDGLEIYYHGWGEQQKLIAALLKAFPEHEESIQWLLGKSAENGRFSGGRIWNYMMLLTAGKRFLAIDDDMVCQPRLAPGHQNRLEVSERPREVRFFLDRDDLLTKTTVSPIDPIEQHADVLGSPIGAAAHHFSAVKLEEQSFKDFRSEQIDALRADSKVLLTQSGILGDPGTVSTDWIYELEGEARSQLVESSESYQVLRASRHLWLGSSSFHFLPNTSLLSTLTGFDNQEMLPCTSPYFRNEDHLFGTLVKALYPTSLALEFPWGLLHFPESERVWKQAVLDKPENVGVLGFLADITSNAMKNCYANHSWQRLTFLAEIYLGLAEGDTAVLEAGIEENLLHARVGKINRLQAQLDTYQGQPSYWAEDVRRLLQAGSNALVSRENRLIPDAATDSGRADQVALVKTLLCQLGSALKVWPLLWRFCQENTWD
ncbi:hypothetical protein [Nitrosococcus oceani]|uniref:Uncharacterized protein n=2 Tax=Nitrosococcus oceani TaxID=1229 RepID=Q3J966_NITOC|nr:hypothetical protein [Nitrosococcus oceani]KFI18931.1 hypothetical protein IB75_11570 [Nitrosococcus oceani C-27]ABA58630.1 hypothetical protein Noc_2170 [Nitrosococcus oceani ATCC 19707]EDZ67504.1 hypothetical protein NOC27_831 [Nitrosococcus oceani AFC27]KFI22213.1 hypothetical protein HW44_11070 [Nitrosococcus oceani]GEM19750.1 hypothetical protein NONS58_11460 [Nitrosococcus oceani]